MRFDRAVYFQRVIPGKYDEETGNYTDPEVIEKKRIASITQSSTQPKGDRNLQIEYGNIREDALTIRLLNPYTHPFDRIRIGDRLYRVDSRFTLRNKQAFIVSEIQKESG